MIFIISMLERRIELSAGPGGTLPLAPGLMVAILAIITMSDLTHGDILIIIIITLVIRF